jgi:hypothetical protein
MRGAIAAALTLSACSAAATPAVQNLSADRTASWVAHGAPSAHRLLYVSDLGRWDVYMYTFPSLRIVGKLTGFNNPQGLCSDAAGNVWIVNAGTDQVLEYAHGGNRVIATLRDPVGVPVGCAIDSATGDLAVTNLYNFSGAGEVLVYVKAAGTPRIYSNSSVYSYYFAAYDRSGNLYVSGSAASGEYLLTTLPKGGKALSLITVKGGTIYFPGTVAWRSSTLLLGDQHCKNGFTSCFYALSLSGKTATIEHSIALESSCDVVQAWAGATQIAGANNGAYCAGRPSRVEIWPFSGGKPSKSVASPREPVGTTLSST